MRRTEHAHACCWEHAGCTNRVPCAGPPERDEDGSWHCAVPQDSRPACDECETAPHCPHCGTWAFHLGERHDDDCPLATPDVAIDPNDVPF